MPQRGGYAAYEQVAAALDIALAGGEITASRHAALETIGRGCFDIIQPEPVIVGGIGETIWIAELARVHGIGCAPHTSGGVIGLAAALQVLATIPDVSTAPATTTPLLEVGSEENPWRTDLATADILTMQDGLVRIPVGPGLGIEIDEDFLRAHAVSHHVVRA
jgi:D-galactarolactone cycloisomerase